MNRTTMKWAAPLCAVALLCAAGGAGAQDKATPTPPKLEPLPDIPPSPGGAELGKEDKSKPRITIRQEGDNKIEEYRINGKLYAIRVTPKVGKPYLMVDREGKGKLSQAEDPGGGLTPPQWTLFEF